MKKTLLALVALLAASAAATGAAAAGGGPAPPAQLGWDGVRAPGADVRYVALAAGSATTVAAIRVDGGRVVRWATLRGGYGIPGVAFDGSTGGLSADGRTLVLASLSTGPVYGGTTRFVVLRLPGLKVRRTIVLPGLWSFDAIAPDGATLYAIEYLAEAPAVHYRVRAIDVSTGRPRPGAIVDKREPDERMNGVPVTRAAGPGAEWVYTLYAKPNGTAFVHALDTVRARAVCIDLPWSKVGQAIWGARMSVAANARSLRLSQRGVGLLATVDLGSFAVRSSRPPVAES